MQTVSYATPVPPVSKKLIWAGRIISTLPVLLLLLSAFMKLSKAPKAVEGFAKQGYPPNMVLILGVVEVTCAIIYVIPQTSVLGAILLTGYLGGAVDSHVRMSDPLFVMPLITGVLVWLGLLFRENRLRPLLPLRSRSTHKAVE
jgi:hypothetical protein